MTDDQFSYVVATHIDKHHIHNHIIICSTDLEGQHKYRDVKQSAKDLAQISDSLCREHELSVIQNPQDKTVSYDKWQGNQRRFTHRDELRMTIDTVLRMQPDGFDALMQLPGRHRLSHQTRRANQHQAARGKTVYPPRYPRPGIQ